MSDRPDERDHPPQEADETAVPGDEAAEEIKPVAEIESSGGDSAQDATGAAGDDAAPVTQAPVTQAPVTQAPVTQAPVTQAPVTQAPVTPAPVTPAPAKRRPWHHRPGVLIGVLTAILGFAIAVQVRSNSSSDSLANAREDDLIRILDDQNARAERLNQQIGDLQRTLDELRVSGNSDAVAEQQAERELQALQVLLGTVPASGPGVAVIITDPQRGLKAEDLLDVVEELRGAGAEAIQFGPVRVGTSTNFTDTASGVSVDGQVLDPPYTVIAIGDPQTLDTALSIPGGVAATARNAGGTAQISEQDKVDVTALRTVPRPKYAAPAAR